MRNLISSSKEMILVFSSSPYFSSSLCACVCAFACAPYISHVTINTFLYGTFVVRNFMAEIRCLALVAIENNEIQSENPLYIRTNGPK